MRDVNKQKDKPPDRLIRKKKEKIEITNFRNDREYITSGHTLIQRIMRECNCDTVIQYEIYILVFIPSSWPQFLKVL